MNSKVKPYTFYAQPFLADKNSAMQGYVTSEPYAIETQSANQAESLSARRRGLQSLFDVDRAGSRSTSNRH